MSMRTDLLDPVPGDAPAGTDLRHDPIYTKVKEARREDDDLPQGDWVTERKVADWGQVIALAGDAIATRSKDLQLALWLTEALMRREGAAGLRSGLELMGGLIEQYWEGGFPELDEGDADRRASLLEWLGGERFAFIVRQRLALNAAGHSLFDLQEGKKLGTEESVVGDARKQNERLAAIEEGKVPPEAFDKSVNETPTEWYRTLVAEIDQSLVAVDALSRISTERFGPQNTPTYVRLRDTLVEIADVSRKLLSRKPDAGLVLPPPGPTTASSTPPGPGTDTSARVSRSGGMSDGGGVMSADVVGHDDANARIAAAATWMRQQDPTNPAAYLLLRGLRWGELRAGHAVGTRARDVSGVSDASDGAPPIDPRMLVAPTTAVRAGLKSLSLDGKWSELLEACEVVMARPEGRGWLDLQRYVLTALRELGDDYAAVAEAIRGMLSTLLRDRPALLSMTMMDDAPTANAETMAWITRELDLSAVPMPEHHNNVSGATNGERARGRGAFDRALDEVRAGSPQRAIELLMRELAKEHTPRGRFLRRIEIARIMVDAGLEPVAQPMLEELLELIETHHLEQWEASDLVAQPLTLLYRVYGKLGTDSETSQPLYLRICRLDPLQAMAVSA
jgi:type VI secretion system protein ImpA